MNHRVVTALCAVALLFVLGGWVWALAALAGIRGLLVLHFSDIAGITAIGGLGPVVFMGAFGALVVVMDFFLAREFDARDRVTGKFLAAMTLVFAILLFMAFAAIINANV
ncbi:MAG TPA: hypothetical protein VMT81_02860 [Candidatus Paceibacterota bacterium]|nr:hypothetical protein [Candidatus Paceibacterota bacterium]